MAQKPEGAQSRAPVPEGSEDPEPSTRERLASAAVAAFADVGFHGTTTRDIAATAGMSPAALYVHHKSKEELLYLLSRAGHDVTLQIIRESVTLDATPTEQLRTFARRFSTHHAVRHTEARVVNYELAALAPEHHAEIMAMRHEMDELIRDLVQRGVDAGEFDTPTPRLTAAAILSLGVDVARWYREGGYWTPDEIGDGYAALALRMVGAGR
jgi:AcrR family transcriptional regulator